MKPKEYVAILNQIIFGQLKISQLLELLKNNHLLSFVLQDAKTLSKIPHRSKIEKLIPKLPFDARHPLIAFFHEHPDETWLDNLITLNYAKPLTASILEALYDLTKTTTTEYANEVIRQLKHYDKAQFITLIQEKKKYFQVKIVQHLLTNQPIKANPKLPSKLRRSATNEGFTHAHKTTCTAEQIKKIEDFIAYIGYEITPHQPDEWELEQLQLVPKQIEKMLLTLVPYTGTSIINCLEKVAIPSGNINQLWSWVKRLSNLYFYQVNHGLLSKTEKQSFIAMIIDLTHETHLEFATTVMDLFDKREIKLEQMQDLMDGLKGLGEQYPKYNDYYPTYASAKDILNMLKREGSPYLPMLKKEIEQSNSISAPNTETLTLSRRVVASQ